jgi:propionyl-CoA carboxylase alpha chain
MKMENVLRAVQDGVVGSIQAQVGDSLSVDQVIIEFE